MTLTPCPRCGCHLALTASGVCVRCDRATMPRSQACPRCHRRHPALVIGELCPPCGVALGLLARLPDEGAPMVAALDPRAVAVAEMVAA